MQRENKIKSTVNDLDTLCDIIFLEQSISFYELCDL